MVATLEYNKQALGLLLRAKTSGAQLADGYVDHATVYTVNAGYTAYMTGLTVVGLSNTYIQTTDGMYAIYDPNQWEYLSEKANVPSYSQSQAQALVQKIINANIRITENNLICARYADKFTAEQKKQIKELQRRVIERSDMLKNDGLLEDVQNGYGYTDEQYAQFTPYLDRLMADGSIGVSQWVVIVVIAAVVASLGTAVYYAYKYYADQAEQDVKFSQELTRTLQTKLTEEEYQQLLNETKGIVTKARISQTFKTAVPILLYVGVGVGVLYLLKKLNIINL